MGDEQRGGLCARQNLQQLDLHEFAGLGVERRERLVEQKELRLHDQRARDIDALAHPAGKLVRVVIGKTGEADQFDQGQRPLPALGLGEPALQVETVHHVFAHGAPGKQAVVLKHHGPVGPRSAHRPSVDQDLAGCHPDEAIDRVEESRLAAARRSDDGDELAVEYLEVEVAQNRERFPGSFVVKVERNAAHLQLRSAHRPHHMLVSSLPATA